MVYTEHMLHHNIVHALAERVSVCCHTLVVYAHRTQQSHKHPVMCDLALMPVATAGPTVTDHSEQI